MPCLKLSKNHRKEAIYFADIIGETQMKIQIYGDIVFLINFCMDYLLILFTCKILGYNSSKKRLAAAASVGGVGAVISFYIPLWACVLLQAALGCVMCLITSPVKRARELLVRCIVLYTTSFVFGGAVTAALCLMRANVMLRGGAFYIDISVKVLAAATALCAVFLTIAQSVIKRLKPHCRREVLISFMGKTVCLKGYIDTGNSLTANGVPVIVAPWNCISCILPSDCTERDFMLHCPPERILCTPFKTVSGDSVIWCIKPDCVRINSKECISAVGVCGERLSEDYDVLLPTELDF